MSKYNSSKVIVDGIEFDSKLESEFYILLKDRLNKDEILWFTIQPKYELIPKYEKLGIKHRSINYSPDFLIKHLDNTLECVDCKGFLTQASELRIKLFNYTYPDIKLTLLSYCKKYGGWIEIDELKKKRKENKVG